MLVARALPSHPARQFNLVFSKAPVSRQLLNFWRALSGPGQVGMAEQSGVSSGYQATKALVAAAPMRARVKIRSELDTTHISPNMGHHR